MALDYAKLMAFTREISQQYGIRDTILYALGIGAGIGADTPARLRYVYEDQLVALPTMAVVLAAPGFWLREPQFGLTWQKILHAEQFVSLHNTLPVEGHVTSVLQVEAIYDKGVEKGALLYSRRQLFEKASGDLLATVRQSAFLRADGGTGGLREAGPEPHCTPKGRVADFSIPLETRAEQALIYRLSGDYNPLHAAPEVAARAGFERPILHGLATYGVVGRALLTCLCDERGTRLKRMDARFSSPVYPGEVITTEVWREGAGRAAFIARVVARDAIVISNGYVEFE